MKQFKNIRTFATVLVTVAAIIFLAKTFLNYQAQAQSIILSTPPIKLIAAFFLFLGHLYLRALSWRSLVAFLGTSVNKKNSLTIWFFSEATRYIPVGKVWSFASRAYLARQSSVPQKTALLILPVEVIIVTATATILSSYAIVKTLERLPVNFTFYLILISSLLITLVLLLLQKIIFKFLKKMLLKKLITKALITALFFQFLSWFFYSVGYMVLIDFSNIQNIALLFSSALLAWLIGYLTLVTPMGLGVRESTFILLTGTQIGMSQAAVVAILARVILIVTELLNLLFWIAARRLRG